MKDIFWEEYPDNGDPIRLNGPCLTHGRFDCLDCCPELCSDDEDYGERYCYECGGRRYVVRCPDDLCHGQDECIHGDPPSPCRVCNPKGELEDASL